MDPQLPIMGPQEDPNKPRHEPNDPDAPRRAPFVYWNFELDAALQAERQENEPRRLQQVQDDLEYYELALEQFQIPDDVVIYEAPRCGDMALFLTAIKRNKALAPHVLHVAFNKELDDLTHCGIVQQLGLEREYSYFSVPPVTMNEYPLVTELCGQETIGGMASDHLRMSVANHPYHVATSYVRQVLRRYDDAIMVGDSELATRTLLSFYGDQWKICPNVRSITLPIEWYNVVSPGGQWLAEYFPNVAADTSYTYMHEGTEYITVGDDQTQRTQAWTQSVEKSLRLYMARKPGDLAFFVKLLHTEGSRVAACVKCLYFNQKYDSFTASGLPELLDFEDWQEPAHRRPLDLDLIHLHRKAVDAAITPVEHAQVNIRLAPSVIFNDNPPLSADRLLASIIADLFSCCKNVRSVLLPNEWVDVFVEAGESLFPLVDWRKKEVFLEFGQTYFGVPKYLISELKRINGPVRKENGA